MSMLDAFYHALSQHSVQLPLLTFLGGVMSSLLPCTVGMLPILIGYIGAVDEEEQDKQTLPEVFWLLRQTLLFILGFSLVLTLLGVAAVLLGQAMGALIGPVWFYALGVLAVVLGLGMLGWIHIPLPQLVTRLPVKKNMSVFSPVLLGAAFGVTSSPCGTPFLTGILGLMGREGNWVLGGLSLFTYALGQSVLLLVMGLFTGWVKHLAALRQVSVVLHKLSGVVFILGGLVLLAKAGHWFGV